MHGEPMRVESIKLNVESIKLNVESLKLNDKYWRKNGTNQQKVKMHNFSAVSALESNYDLYRLPGAD